MWTPSQVSQARSCGFECTIAGGRWARQGANYFSWMCRGQTTWWRVLLSAATQTYVYDLSQYPQWLVVLVGTLLLAVILWILIKVLKWALWLLLVAVLVGGLFWTGWLLVG